MPNPGGYIYLIESVEQNASKVGYGVDPLHRLVQMQTGNPQPLVLAAALPADYSAERTLHQLVATYRMRSRLEWFTCMGLLRNIFCQLEEEVAGLEFDDEDYTVTADMVGRIGPSAIAGYAEYLKEYGEYDLEPVSHLELQSEQFYPPHPSRLSPRRRREAGLPA